MVTQQIFLAKAQQAIADWKDRKIPEPRFRVQGNFNFMQNHVGEIPREITVISELIVGELVGLTPSSNQPVYEFDALRVVSILT